MCDYTNSARLLHAKEEFGPEEDSELVELAYLTPRCNFFPYVSNFGLETNNAHIYTKKILLVTL